MDLNSPPTGGMGLDVKRELASLKQRFETAAAHYEALKAAAEGTVKQWMWATATCYHLDPLFYLDDQMTRGRVMETPPRFSRGRLLTALPRRMALL